MPPPAVANRFWRRSARVMTHGWHRRCVKDARRVAPCRHYWDKYRGQRSMAMACVLYHVRTSPTLGSSHSPSGIAWRGSQSGRRVEQTKAATVSCSLRHSTPCSILLGGAACSNYTTTAVLYNMESAYKNNAGLPSIRLQQTRDIQYTLDEWSGVCFFFSMLTN